MKKVLAIIGSPRKLGNCEIMAKEISRHIPEDHELRLLRLSDFNLLPCRGCYLCLFKEKGCVIDDDLNQVIAAMAAADALMVLMPTYFLGPNSCLKRLLDRGLAFYAHADRLWGKPAVGVGIAGIKGKEGYTLLGIESFLSSLLTEKKFCDMVYGALPGEVFFDETNTAEAARIGKALFSEAVEKSGPACPLCGGETFRFLGADRVRCMLCSNDGRIDLQNATTRFEMSPGPHEFFLNREEALRHKEWLVGMKSRFIEQKSRLKEITVGYREDGVWLKPVSQSES